MTSAAPDFEEILSNLAARGIKRDSYIRIKELVSFNFPLARVTFVRRFGKRTIEAILKEIETWKCFVATQSLFTLDDKITLDRLISGAEWLTWYALLESNLPQVGPWSLSWFPLPTGKDEYSRPQYLRPALKVIAIHRDTQEKRETVLPSEEYNIPAKWPAAWKRAFEELQIWHLIYRGSPHKGLVSARLPRGWPLFTRFIIPALYEYLLPFYEKRGHYSRTCETIARPRARFPNELVETMLDILRLEHPEIFASSTTSQVKGVIQRHLDKKLRRITIRSK
jgi:hypothetical protein